MTQEIPEISTEEAILFLQALSPRMGPDSIIPIMKVDDQLVWEPTPEPDPEEEWDEDGVSIKRGRYATVRLRAVETHIAERLEQSVNEAQRLFCESFPRWFAWNDRGATGFTNVTDQVREFHRQLPKGWWWEGLFRRRGRHLHFPLRALAQDENGQLIPDPNPRNSWEPWLYEREAADHPTRPNYIKMETNLGVVLAEASIWRSNAIQEIIEDFDWLWKDKAGPGWDDFPGRS